MFQHSIINNLFLFFLYNIRSTADTDISTQKKLDKTRKSSNTTAAARKSSYANDGSRKKFRSYPTLTQSSKKTISKSEESMYNSLNKKNNSIRHPSATHRQNKRHQHTKYQDNNNTKHQHTKHQSYSNTEHTHNKHQDYPNRKYRHRHKNNHQHRPIISNHQA
ncbi:hypothetical protein CDIK_1165 [Cucumispora dikerogammari]|nr:hypothetical protein CDIK_1165 [Cucumispora dikerogammari]